LEKPSINDIKAYTGDPKHLIRKGRLWDSKPFFRSFIKRIEVNMPRVAINHTIPLNPYETGNSEEEFYPANSSLSTTRRSSNLVLMPGEEECKFTATIGFPRV
jgi:hypothetical protein